MQQEKLLGQCRCHGSVASDKQSHSPLCSLVDIGWRWSSWSTLPSNIHNNVILPIHKKLFEVFRKGLWQLEKCVSSSESSKKHGKYNILGPLMYNSLY